MTAAGGASGTTGVPKLASGISGLDTILRGGFLTGGITIIQGRPGAGKTILGNQLCFNHVAAGGRALYVTLLAENHSRMLMHLSSLDFYEPAAIPGGLYYISAFPVLEAEGVRGVLTLLRREVQSRGATLLVLDGLVAAENAASSDLEFKKFIHELQTQATIAGCTMFLLTSAGSETDLITAEHTMVDCVIELRSQHYGWRAARDLEIRKRRGDGFIRGRHAFRISPAGISVFPRFEALLARPSQEERYGGERLGTGLPQLDQMFGGGIPPHSTTMLLGPSGVGKTTFGLQFLSQCNAEEPGLFFGFFENRTAIQEKAAALGLPLLDLMDQGHVEMIWQPTTEALLDEVCARLMGAVRDRGVKRVFIDGLAGFIKVAYERDRVSHIFTAFSNELRALGVTSVFTNETEDLSGNFGAMPVSGLAPGTVSSLAENIITLRFAELRSTLWRLVSLMKARDSRIDTRLRVFTITECGIVIDDGPERAEAVLAEVNGQGLPRTPAPAFRG